MLPKMRDLSEITTTQPIASTSQTQAEAQGEVRFDQGDEQPLFLTVDEIERWISFLEKPGDARMRAWGLVAGRFNLRPARILSEDAVLNQPGSFGPGTEVFLGPDKEPNEEELEMIEKLNQRRIAALQGVLPQLGKDAKDFLRMEKQARTWRGFTMDNTTMTLMMASMLPAIFLQHIQGSSIISMALMFATMSFSYNTTRQTCASAERQGGTYSLTLGPWSPMAAYSLKLAIGSIPDRGKINKS